VSDRISRRLVADTGRHHRRREARRQLLASDVRQRAQVERCGRKWATKRSELMASLLPALRALADDLRTVFMMCEMEEIPGAEVARILKPRSGPRIPRRTAEFGRTVPEGPRDAVRIV
jgi:DNA-directed RNA polymerase specialized sigma24 family protein